MKITIKITELFSKFNFINKALGWDFYFKQRWKQFVRLMTNTSVLPSILLGIATFSTTLIYTETSTGVNEVTDTNTVLIVLTSIFLSIAVCVFLGRGFFRAQTPKVYAEFSIAGTTPSYSFLYISYCIWKECLFIHKRAHLFTFFEENSITKDFKKIHEFKRDLDSFNSSFQKRYDRVQKINFMLLGLAKSMYIPPYRISDFLFQFSPDIYYQEIKNAIQKMEELYITAIENRDSCNHDSFKKTASNLTNISKGIEKRMKYQKDIVLNKDLHNFIINMSFGYGLSDAFGSYCLGLQYCVKPKLKEKSDTESIRNRLIFMYHKRRMYSGFDLHALLYSFIDKLHKTHPENNDLFEFKMVLSKISNNKNKGLDSAELSELGTLINNMSNLSKTYENFRFLQIKNISAQFKEELITIIKSLKNNGNNKNKLIFITQGYSSVVNYVLKQIAKDINIATSAADLSDLHSILVNKNVSLEYYILDNAEKDQNKEKVVARHLRYKFKENPNIPKKSDYRINVKIGDEKWLKSMIGDNEEVPKIVISGAEFIQERELDNKKENRIINNETIIDFIKGLSKDNEKYYKWFILAENYKIFPLDIDSILTYKIAMTNDYLEELSLCNWSDEMKIITFKPKETQPKETQPKETQPKETQPKETQLRNNGKVIDKK